MLGYSDTQGSEPRQYAVITRAFVLPETQGPAGQRRLGFSRSAQGQLGIKYPGCRRSNRLRPYSVKRTVSRPNCAVKPLQALSVLRWGTTWESGVP